MEYKNVFSHRIKELRLQQEISQQNLGLVIGLTKPTISKIEHGTKGVSVEMLIALADYFNVSTDYLLGRTDKP